MKFQKLEIKIECFLGNRHSRDISNGLHALNVEKAFSPLFEYSKVYHDGHDYKIEPADPKLDDDNKYTHLQYNNFREVEDKIRQKSKKFSITISQGAITNLEFFD